MDINKIHQGNCLEVMKTFDDNSVDMIFADPPYFLSNNGITCKSGKAVSVKQLETEKKKLEK
jgi:site-specific DNA-methyltransferase (adenine-specific)